LSGSLGKGLFEEVFEEVFEEEEEEEEEWLEVLGNRSDLNKN
jgi:hypothetical protein